MQSEDKSLMLYAVDGLIIYGQQQAEKEIFVIFKVPGIAFVKMQHYEGTNFSYFENNLLNIRIYLILEIYIYVCTYFVIH